MRQSAAHLLPALNKKSCPDQREPLTGHREGTVGHRLSPQHCCQEVGDPPEGPNRSAIFSHVGAWHGVDLKQLIRIPRDTPWRATGPHLLNPGLGDSPLPAVSKVSIINPLTPIPTGFFGVVFIMFKVLIFYMTHVDYNEVKCQLP